MSLVTGGIAVTAMLAALLIGTPVVAQAQRAPTKAAPTTFTLSLNLKTAQALGLSIPPLLRLCANDVLE